MLGWFKWHSLWQHIAAPIWIHIPEKGRWAIVNWLNKSPRRCWCDLVDDALASREDDPCDVHIPMLRPGPEPYCARECRFMHSEHSGSHACACYCGKFQFPATDGAIERRAS